jgi:hypothetical protein
MAIISKDRCVVDELLTGCGQIAYLPACISVAGGKYYYLPNASDAAIAMAASDAMAAAKML